MTELTQAEFDAVEPCPECGASEGNDPSTGITVRGGHRWGCSHA